MGILEILNLILGLVLEPIALVYSAYYFMSNVERRVYLPKKYYVAGFAVFIIAVTAGSLFFRDDRISAVTGIVLISVLGYFFFQRSLVGVAYDIVFIIGVFLCQTAVIMAAEVVILENGLGSVLFFADVSLVIKIVTVVLLTRLFVYAVNRVKFASLPKLLLFSILILPVFSIIFLLSMWESSVLYFQMKGFGLYVLNAILLIIVNLYFIYLFGYVFKARNLERDLKVYREKNEIQFRYYEELEKKYQESRKMIHDMKNHLQAVEELYGSGETERGSKYVKGMYHLLNSYGEKYYSDNKMLNIILNDKFTQAERDGVRTKAMMGEADLSFMSDLDITTIFANLLDNALYASRQVKNSDITIKMDTFNEFIVVSIQNSAVQPHETECSQKRNREGHMGLGLVNVRQTLEKYHGTLQTEQNGGEFQVNITIPINDVHQGMQSEAGRG